DVDLYESDRRRIKRDSSPDPIRLEIGYVERIVAVEVIDHAVGDARIDCGVTPVAPIRKLQVFNTVHKGRGDGRSRSAIHRSSQTRAGRATVACPGLHLIGYAL